MNIPGSAVPLCIPNNFDWKKSDGRLVQRPGAEQSGLKPCEEGLQILRSIEGPLCVVCVCGPERSGKSYLLNQLQSSTFRTGQTNDHKTKGKY